MGKSRETHPSVYTYLLGTYSVPGRPKGGVVDKSCSTPTMAEYENPEGPKVQEGGRKQRASGVLRKEEKGNTGT